MTDSSIMAPGLSPAGMGLRVDRLSSRHALYRTEPTTRCDTTCDVPRGFLHDP